MDFFFLQFSCRILQLGVQKKSINCHLGCIQPNGTHGSARCSQWFRSGGGGLGRFSTFLCRQTCLSEGTFHKISQDLKWLGYSEKMEISATAHKIRQEHHFTFQNHPRSLKKVY